MSSMSFHGVTQIEVKEPKFSNGHSWTTLVITHRSTGNNEEGEYAEVIGKTEIALHHKPNFHGVIPLVLEGDVS